MLLSLNRFTDNDKVTLGTLHVNGKLQCFTLEDAYNEPKVYGKTRIYNAFGSR